MYKIGPYELSWKNPVQYFILWTFTTLLLLVVAGFAPSLAILFAFGVAFATIVGLMNKRRP